MDRLPEALLILIISLLPFKEAVRTSTIAKQWRDLWRYVSCVDIDMQDMLKQCGLCYEETQHYNEVPSRHSLLHTSRLMNKLVSNRLTKITCFRLVFPSLNSNFDKLKKSIKLVMNKNSTEELTLVWNPLPYMFGNAWLELPSGMFSCGTLRLLNLTNFRLVNASDLKGCNKIKTLKLESVFLTEQVIHAINGLESLEDLMISTSEESEVADLKISAKSLKKLGLTCFDVISFEVSVPGLDVLILKDISCSPDCLVIKSTKITVFHADNVAELGNEDIVELVHKCLSLRELKLYSCPKLEKINIDHDNLRVLEIGKINLSSMEIRGKKLDVLVLSKVICPSRDILIHTPNLIELRSFTKRSNLSQEHLLRPADVLEYFIKLFEAQPGSGVEMGCARTLENLRTLVGDFDLNSSRDITILSRIFGICTRLLSLHITIKETKAIPDAKIVYGFWDKKSYSPFTFRLRNVEIQGYRNTCMESDFVKYMITKAEFLEKISIRALDKESQEDTYASSELLLTLPRASFVVSIVFVSFCGKHKVAASSFGSLFRC